MVSTGRFNGAVRQGGFLNCSGESLFREKAFCFGQQFKSTDQLDPIEEPAVSKLSVHYIAQSVSLNVGVGLP